MCCRRRPYATLRSDPKLCNVSDEYYVRQQVAVLLLLGIWVRLHMSGLHLEKRQHSPQNTCAALAQKCHTSLTSYHPPLQSDAVRATVSAVLSAVSGSDVAIDSPRATLGPNFRGKIAISHTTSLHTRSTPPPPSSPPPRRVGVPSRRHTATLSAAMDIVFRAHVRPASARSQVSLCHQFPAQSTPKLCAVVRQEGGAGGAGALLPVTPV